MIIINGKKIDFIEVIKDIFAKDGKVIINGKTVFKSNQDITINIDGNVENIDCAGNVNVKGNVTGDIDANGNVDCQNVGGNIDCNGGVTCGTVNGDIDANGSVSIKK